MGQGILSHFCSRPPGKSAATGCSWFSRQLQASGAKAGPRTGKGVPSFPPLSNPSCCYKRASPPQEWLLPAGKSKAQGRELFVPSANATSALSSSWGRRSLPGCVSGAEPALSSHNHGPGSPDNPSLLWGQPKITEALFGTSISDQGQTLLRHED